MAKTTSGVLFLTKTDKKEIKELLHHVARDISFDAGGTFGDGERVFTKELRMVQSAVKTIEFILEL